MFEFGRMSVIQDPTGAVFGLWESKLHTGAGIVGEPNSMCWQELNTTDTDRAADFYSGVFGWEPQKQAMLDFVYTYFKQGERMSGGMMKIQAEWGPVPPHWMVYFAVDDCDGKAGPGGEAGREDPHPTGRCARDRQVCPAPGSAGRRLRHHQAPSYGHGLILPPG